MVGPYGDCIVFPYEDTVHIVSEQVRRWSLDFDTSLHVKLTPFECCRTVVVCCRHSAAT